MGSDIKAKRINPVIVYNILGKTRPIPSIKSTKKHIIKKKKVGEIYVPLKPPYNSFLFATAHFPEETSNRYELVAEFVRSQPNEGNASSPSDAWPNRMERDAKERKLHTFFITAGKLALIRPCGIVVNMTEMYTQVFIFLLRTFCADSEGF